MERRMFVDGLPKVAWMLCYLTVPMFCVKDFMRQ